jgi:hypothetical protein
MSSRAKQLTFIEKSGRVAAGVCHCCGARFLAPPDTYQPQQIRDDILTQFGQHKCAPGQGRDPELLRKLKWLLTKKGYLSEELVKRTAGMPSLATIYHRFGRFERIYRILGYRPRSDVFTGSEHREQTYHVRDQLIHQLKVLFPNRIRVVHSQGKTRPEVQLNGGYRISISICRAKRKRDGALQWMFHPVPKDEREHFMLLCLLDESNTKCSIYYVLPSAKMGSNHSFKQDDPMLAKAIRVDDLSQIPEIVEGLQ